MSAFFSLLYPAREPTCDVEKLIWGGPNAPTSHACEKTGLMPFQDSPVSHDATNSNISQGFCSFRPSYICLSPCVAAASSLRD